VPRRKADVGIKDGKVTAIGRRLPTDGVPR